MLIPDDITIYLRLEVTDMRKSIDTLCIVVADILKLNPSSGHLFLFRNRKGDKMKALFYRENCFTLIYCRLEKGKFIFPRNGDGHIEISKDHLRWLLASNKYSRLDSLEETPFTLYRTFFEILREFNVVRQINR